MMLDRIFCDNDRYFLLENNLIKFDRKKLMKQRKYIRTNPIILKE